MTTFNLLLINRGYFAGKCLSRLLSLSKIYSSAVAPYSVAKKYTSSTKLSNKFGDVDISCLQNAKRFLHETDAGVTLTNVKRKKRPTHGENDFKLLGFYNVTAYATAEEYDLEKLLIALRNQKLYEVKKFFSTDNLNLHKDVLYASNYQSSPDMRDIFFFREGSVVMWNFDEIESSNLLNFMRSFEKDPYMSQLVQNESEVMPYTYIPSTAVDVEGDIVHSEDVVCAYFQNGKFYLTSGEENFLSKYTFSNAMSTSIKLGIWEATLDRYIDSMEFITNDMKRGRRIRISRAEVLRKTGELLALRHFINLSSDLLDTPDFYWDRENYERLYLKVCSYFAITRRTKVMNEKINHCVELAELISHNLNEAHNTRLEWMIIILIMIEVAFEIVHYIDRYYAKEENSAYDQPINDPTVHYTQPVT